MSKEVKQESKKVVQLIETLNGDMHFKNELGMFYVVDTVKVSTNKDKSIMYTYKCVHKDISRGYTREIIPSFPLDGITKDSGWIEYPNLDHKLYLREIKSGNKSCCHLIVNNTLILSNVCKQALISSICDLVPSNWNKVDQVIKSLLGLKSSIRNGSGITKRSFEELQKENELLKSQLKK